MTFQLHIKDTKGNYVKNVSPLEVSTSESDAKKFTVDVDPIDADAFETAFVNDFRELVMDSGSVDWIINVVDPTGTVVSSILANATGISWGRDDSLDDTTTRCLYELALTIKDYYMDILLVLASKAAKGLATAIGDADGTDKDAVGKSFVDTSVSGKASEDELSLINLIKDKTKADIVKPKETLADYVCSPSMKLELEEVVNFFRKAKLYEDAGVRIPKGILFKGLPGTGKTYAARCIAGTVDCYFMTCTASALQGQYIGSGAENIRQLFQGAKKLRDVSKKGVIIFLDELDSFGSRDSHGGSASGEEDRTLNQLLAEMSGFDDSENIMILGATNYAERIDDALLRSGRFSRQITIEIPNQEERRSLIQYYLSKLKIPCDSEVTADTLVPLMQGMTPADISEVINEAGILTLRYGEPSLKVTFVNEAINKVITKNIRHPDKSDEFVYKVTVHECGHVLAEFLYEHKLSTKVTNFSYGDAGGFTQPGESTDSLYSKQNYLGKVFSLLGGRAAEALIFGDDGITTGASEDLKRATDMLKKYYTVFHFEYYDPEKLDTIVLDKLTDMMETCRNTFEAKKDLLDKLTALLKKERTLYKLDIAAILS